MDEETAERVKSKVLELARENDVTIDQLVLFGSRARDDYTEESDVDLVLVSEDFEGSKWYRRGEEFQYGWDYGELPAPEFICVTPEEFEERKKKKADIIREAFETGIKLA
jgi:predicted nucleotidyltransferase